MCLVLVLVLVLIHIRILVLVATPLLERADWHSPGPRGTHRHACVRRHQVQGLRLLLYLRRRARRHRLAASPDADDPRATRRGNLAEAQYVQQEQPRSRTMYDGPWPWPTPEAVQF